MAKANHTIAKDRRLLAMGAALVAQHRVVMDLHDEHTVFAEKETKKQREMERKAPKALRLNGQDRLWLSDAAALHRDVFDVYLLDRLKKRKPAGAREKELIRVASKYWKRLAAFTRARKVSADKANAADAIASKIARKILASSPPVTVAGILSVARAGRFLCSCPDSLDQAPKGHCDDEETALYKIIAVSRRLLGARHD